MADRDNINHCVSMHQNLGAQLRKVGGSSIVASDLKWEDFLHLAEFAYNKNYQTSIKMISFEDLYGIKWHTPLSWSESEDILILGLYALHEME